MNFAEFLRIAFLKKQLQRLLLFVATKPFPKSFTVFDYLLRDVNCYLERAQTLYLLLIDLLGESLNCT